MTAISAPEPALAAGEDPRAYAAVLHAVYDAEMAGERAPARPREVISDSWRRVKEAGVDPDSGGAEPTLDGGQVQSRRADSGLGEVLEPVMRNLASAKTDLKGFWDGLAQSAAAVYWRIIRPERVPGSRVRNAGRLQASPCDVSRR